MTEESQIKHRGACLCGGVRYALTAEPGPIGLCHCQSCRKANGSAFAANAPIDAVHFQLRCGKDLVRDFESSPGKHRVFCGRCGSPVYSRSDRKPGVLRLRIGLLETPLAQQPAFHFMVAHKAEWDDICDALPQYAEYEPARK